MEMVLEILFFIFDNANIQFAKKKLNWRSYTATETLSTSKQIELIDKKEFAKAALDEESKTFVVYVAALEASLESAQMIMQPLQVAQIAVLK